ncbi:MAG: GGDEF domain-containing protein [Lachnospiraceae bacterium]|nr:GGDEF domain-containing protein [Lachnospiraceae bacterium]
MKTIAIMIGNNQSEYIKALMNEFDVQSKKLGVRLIFLSGYRVIDECQDDSVKENNTKGEINNYQFSTIYDYVGYAGCDACIVCYGPISGVPGAPSIDDILELTANIPTMFLEDRADGAPYIICDNYNSMREMVSHLVVEHGYKNIAFLAGPKGNYSSELRLKAYRDVLSDNNIDVDDKLIAYGDYTIRVKSIVESLIDNNPDIEAICCANDNMARACYNVCAKRGLVVGKDIAITGFDNSDISSKLVPALSTVNHDGRAIVSKALDMAINLSDGKPVDSVEHPAQSMIRCSCGCNNEQVDEDKNLTLFTEVFANENINDYNINNEELKEITVALAKENEHLKSRFWDVSFFVREFIENNVKTDKYFEKLFIRLRESGLSNAYFFVHKTPLIYESDELGGEDKNYKKHMYFAGGFNDEGSTIIPVKEWHHYQISHRKGFNQFLPEYDKKGNFHTYVLFAGESQYGVMLSEAEVSDNEFLLYISLQISNLLHIFNLKTREEAVIQEMERSIERVKESNQILSFISRYDELTKILNRRGFMEQALATIHRIKGREAMIMFADLDHLKEINDCFGHGDGDFAITSAAKLLKGLMPRDGFVARIGGDEFVAFIPVPGDVEAKDHMKNIKDKLKEAMFLFNLTCNKPYFVELSSGFHSFVCEADMDLAKIIASSDEVLYEDKQKRRESIKKG